MKKLLLAVAILAGAFGAFFVAPQKASAVPPADFVCQWAADHHVKFNGLRPLTVTDAVYVNVTLSYVDSACSARVNNTTIDCVYVARYNSNGVVTMPYNPSCN